MQSEKRKPEEQTFSDKLEQFIIKYRKPLIIGISVIVLGLIVFGIATTVYERRIEDYTRRVEQAQDLFEEYQQADEDRKTEISVELQSNLNDIIDSLGSQYPGLRALHILGELAYEEERFDDSHSYFTKIAEQFPDSHLAPVALMNAAVISEQKESFQQAIEYYQRVVETYSNEYHGAPRALLNIGRLYEKLDDPNAAIRAYEQLAADFTGTEWANLAQTRKIQLEIGM